MTLDEATAALAANPATLYLAGRDVDDLIQVFLKPPVRPGYNKVPDGFEAIPASGVPTAAELQYPADNQKVVDFRNSLIGVDQATALMLTTNAINDFGGILAARKQNEADEMAARAAAP